MHVSAHFIDSMKIKVSRPKVLFLQGLREDPHHIDSLVTALNGDDCLFIISAKNQAITFCIWTTITLLILFISLEIIISFLFFSLLAGILSLVFGLVSNILIYAIGSHLRKVALLWKATLDAEKAWKSFRPNLLVASGFGAVIAFNMKTPGIPALLLTPAQNRYTSDILCLRRVTPSFSLSKFPFTVICHGASDSHVPIEDSLELMKTVPDRRTYLITLDSEDSSLKGVLSDTELQDLLFYAYHEGWITAFGSTYKERLIFQEEETDRHDGGNESDSLITKRHNPSFVNLVFDGNPPEFDFSILDLRDVVAFGTLALARLHQEHHQKRNSLSATPTISKTIAKTTSEPIKEEEKTIVIDPELLEDTPDPLVETSDKIPEITWRLSTFTEEEDCV